MKDKVINVTVHSVKDNVVYVRCEDKPPTDKLTGKVWKKLSSGKWETYITGKIAHQLIASMQNFNTRNFTLLTDEDGVLVGFR